MVYIPVLGKGQYNSISKFATLCDVCSMLRAGREIWGIRDGDGQCLSVSLCSEYPAQVSNTPLIHAQYGETPCNQPYGLKNAFPNCSTANAVHALLCMCVCHPLAAACRYRGQWAGTVVSQGVRNIHRCLRDCSPVCCANFPLGWPTEVYMEGFVSAQLSGDRPSQ